MPSRSLQSSLVYRQVCKHLQWRPESHSGLGEIRTQEGFREEEITKPRWKTVHRISQLTIFCPYLSGFLHTPDSVHAIWAEKRWLGRVTKRNFTGGRRVQETPFTAYHFSIPLLKRSSRISQLRPESGFSAISHPRLSFPCALETQGHLAKSLFDLVWKAVG